MVNSQDIEVVQGAVRYPRPFHGASLPLPLNYSLRPFFGTGSSRPRRTQQAKGSARSENGGAGGLGGPRWAPGGRSDDYIASSAKWTRVIFFLLSRSLWAVRLPWYTCRALFVTTKLTSYHKTRYNLLCALTTRERASKRPTTFISLASDAVPSIKKRSLHR